MTNFIPEGVKFIHLRRYTNWFDDGLDRNRSIYHAKGGATIAYDYDIIENLWLAGIAKCSKKDHYNKKIGRNVALGRMISNPIHLEINPMKPLIPQIVNQIEVRFGLKNA
jgi:hypothetical protein